MPTVSVVMSCYNGAKYIKEAIDSVLSQTYRDFELIIWNDGSTDNSEELILEYRDPRIRYFSHNNVGLGGALSLACKEAHGEFIARIDADDICMPNRLERQVSFLRKHSDCVLVSSAVYFIDSEGKSYGRNYPYTDTRIISRLIGKSNPITHPATMFRKTIYDRTIGYQNIWGCEDVLLWLQFIKLGKICNLTEALIKYRLDSSSIMHQKYSHPYKNVILALTKKIIEEEGNNEFDNKLLVKFRDLRQKSVDSDASLFYGKTKSTTIAEKIRLIIGDRCPGLIVYMKNKLWIMKHIGCFL